MSSFILSGIYKLMVRPLLQYANSVWCLYEEVSPKLNYYPKY